MGARALVSARWWGGTWARRPPYVAPALDCPPIEFLPLLVDASRMFDEAALEAQRAALFALVCGGVPTSLLTGRPMSGLQANDVERRRRGEDVPAPDGPGLYPSPCCQARSQVLQLLSAGQESNEAWLTGAAPATADEMRLECTACSKKWRRPRKLVVRADGFAIET